MKKKSKTIRAIQYLGGTFILLMTACAADESGSDPVPALCPAGMTLRQGGDACEATLCAENEHVLDHACAPCPAGTTHPQGADASGDNTACEPTLCAENEYVLDHACVPCPAGSFHLSGADASADDSLCTVPRLRAGGPGASFLDPYEEVIDLPIPPLP